AVEAEAAGEPGGVEKGQGELFVAHRSGALIANRARSPGQAGGRGAGSMRLVLGIGFWGGVCQEDAQASCCTRDEGGPFEVALKEEASNRHELLRSKAAVVNVMVKRRGSDHVRYG